MLPSSRFKSFLDQHKLLRQGENALLAVSGGRDSVLMTKLFNDASLPFGIAHCNFTLRGEESDADEQFVREIAGQYGVPFYAVRFDTANYAAERKISIQMAARELRYDWLERIRIECGYDNIALAHHASDVTETVLLNLVRGTGIAGLHGILPRRGNFIRPLLFLSREEINQTIASEKLAFREDSSNLSSKYARNKLRLEVIPKLKELNAGLDETFERTSQRLSQVEAFLNNEVDKLREKLFKPVASETFEIDLSEVAALQPRELLLYELFKPFNFREPVLEDLALSWDGDPGKIFFSASHALLLDREKLILEPKNQEQVTELLWEKDLDGITFLGESFKLFVEDKPDSFSADSQKAFFDESLVQFPLRLRLWKDGDFFYPLGMKGKKKLSDFLREMKVPLSHKSRVPLLVNGNGDILWVAGYRSDNRYKVRPETKKVITFEKTS